MTCDRCYKPLDVGVHGLYHCPLEARRQAPVVRPDDIPGGMEIQHGLCNADGTPRKYYSRSEINLEAQKRGLMNWSEKYEEIRLKDARVHDDWLKSGEAQRARRDRDEQRAEKRLVRR